MVLTAALLLLSSTAYGAEIKRAVDFSFHESSQPRLCQVWVGFGADDQSEAVKLSQFGFRSNTNRLVLGFRVDVARYSGPATGFVNSEVILAAINTPSFHSLDNFTLSPFSETKGVAARANTGADFINFGVVFAEGQYDLSFTTSYSKGVWHAYKIDAPIPEEYRTRHGHCLDALVKSVQ